MLHLQIFPLLPYYSSDSLLLHLIRHREIRAGAPLSDPQEGEQRETQTKRSSSDSDSHFMKTKVKVQTLNSRPRTFLRFLANINIKGHRSYLQRQQQRGVAEHGLLQLIHYYLLSSQL